jgi:predicted small integral membrane protein
VTAIRICKMGLLMSVAFFFTLVGLSNTADFNSSLQHVLMMDSTYPGNRGKWRAVHAPWIHLALLSGDHWIGDSEYGRNLVGKLVLFRAFGKSETEFQRAKQVGCAALTVGML